MSRKLGDGFIAVMLLLFVVSLFSYLFISMDDATGINSGKVSESLLSAENSLDDIKGSQQTLIDKTDETSDFSVEEESQQIESRGSDAGGFMNVLSKNILTQFFNAITREIPGSEIVLTFIATIVGVIFSVLFLRFFWGDNKI